VLNRISVKSKLIIMLLAVSLGSILVIGYLSGRSMRAALTQAAFDHLTSLRAAKAHQLETYARNLHRQLEIVAKGSGIIRAMVHLNKAFKQLDYESIPKAWDDAIETFYQSQFLPRVKSRLAGNPDFDTFAPHSQAARFLQYHYIAANQHPVSDKRRLDDAGDGSDYSQFHQRYHPLFRAMVEELGYGDLYLIDFDTQTIVYSVSKEVDLGTSLKTGPYAGSGLAEAVQVVLEQPAEGAVHGIDFRFYTPSYGAPVAFFAIPLYNGPHIVGILATQYPVDELNNVMTSNRHWKADGLGDSGETYLVGPDLRMRSASRVFLEDPQGYAKTLAQANVPQPTIDAIQQFGTTILLQQVDTAAAQAALRGEDGVRLVEDYRGIPVLSAYAPLELPGGRWAVMAEMELAEVMQPIVRQQRMLLIATVILALVVIMVAIVLSNLFVRPVDALVVGAQDIASGKDEVEVRLSSQDEFGRLAQTFNAMVQQLRQQNERLDEKDRENHALLLNLLPKVVAERVRKGELRIADSIQQMSLVFASLQGFTELSAQQEPLEAAALLHEWIDALDRAAERHGLERHSLIGERCLVVCGLTTPYLDHVNRALDFALEVAEVVKRFNFEHDTTLQLLMGIHTGPVMAGIVGATRFHYDLWGKTVNIASALESAAAPDMILVSQEVYDRTRDLYVFTPQPEITMNTGTRLTAWGLQAATGRPAATPDRPETRAAM
jgi:class 3 adenylate cyclase